MTTLTLCLIAAGLCFAAAAGLAFVAVVRSGYLDDLEDVKFHMLREDDDP